MTRINRQKRQFNKGKPNRPKKPRPPKHYNSAGIPIEGERTPRTKVFPGQDKQK